MEDYGTEMEAIEQERLDADMLQAQYERESAVYSARERRSQKLRSEGKLDEAARECPHGSVGLLAGLCSEDDPRYGEEGFRCHECGSVVDEIGGRVIHACEEIPA